MIDSRTAPYAALLLRVSLGVMFIAHGLLKLLVFTLPGTVAFFEQTGFPGWTAYLVTFGELAAGALLILGIQTRWVALATVPILLGAASVHWANGWVFSAPNGGWEYPVFWAVVMVVQALLGDGAHALKPSAGTPAPRAA
ncbi:MAG TPA: DoxX family protein [Alphaproteobacteria bacterium]|jgi:putative oxidoreductase|nr:DoxX family protein [Alphaproteobacteria bacterium]